MYAAAPLGKADGVLTYTAADIHNATTRLCCTFFCKKCHKIIWIAALILGVQRILIVRRHLIPQLFIVHLPSPYCS